jgi:hypothetical protein
VRLQSVVNNNSGIQITYLLESDQHPDSGIMEARTLDIPHEALPQDLLDDLVDSAESIVEHARVVRRAPVDQFRAPR